MIEIPIIITVVLIGAAVLYGFTPVKRSTSSARLEAETDYFLEGVKALLVLGAAGILSLFAWLIWALTK